MPPKAPPAKSSTKSRSPSPPSKGAAGKKKPAGSADVAGSVPAPSATTKATVEVKLTPEAAARLIQAVGRALLARYKEGREHKKHIAKKIEKDAEDRIFAQSRLDRQRREKASQIKKDEETKEQQKRRLLEALSVASFDGNVAEIKKLVAQGVDIFGKDGQGNNAIGEAAVNGQCEAIAYLAQIGCDPNFRGEYDRTPLWRAAFNSHTEAMRMLLELGADPRMRAQGQTPDELCGQEGKQLIASWDLSKTDAMVAKFSRVAADRDNKRREEAQAVSNSLTSSSEDLKQRLDSKQKELLHHKQEYEKRIVEYDTVNCEHTTTQELKQVALDCIKAAEKDVERSAAEVAALQEEYFALRTKIALHNHEELGEALEGTEFPFKKLADVVFDDTDKLWKATGKWPLIFDVSGKSRTFLKYRNVVFIDTFSPNQMEKDSLRRGVLGALRYGKPMVVDLRDVPMLSNLEERFNQIRPNLFQEIVTKKVFEKEVYMSLLRQPQDGPEFAEERFTSVGVNEASFVFVSQAMGVDERLGTIFTLLCVEQ